MMDFSVPHVYLSTALENMLEEYLIITQLILMGISTTLPQKAACGPHRQMGMLPKIETKVIRNIKFSRTFRMKVRKAEIHDEMQI